MTLSADEAADELARVDPAFALVVGELKNAGRLPPGRASFPLERLETLNALAARARAELDTAEPATRIDLAHFVRCVEAESFALIELGERLKNPDVLTPLGDWAMTLLFAPFSTEQERGERLEHFVSEIQFYLAEAATTLGEPDALWRDIAVEVAGGIPDLLQAIVAYHRPAEKAAARASAALVDYVRALRSVRAREGSRLLDRDTFAKLLTMKGIALDLRDLEELARERIGQLGEKRAELSKALTGYTDGKNAQRALDADAPASFAEGLAELRAAAREARELCGERALVPFPRDEELLVIETPAFARPLIPFAAINVPKPRWPLQRSVYLCTRVRNRAELRNVVVHEAWPGHHLQFAYSNERGSLWRNAQWNAALHAQMGVDTFEGWAHYTEALMAGQGFTSTPAERYQVCNDALWRAHRILLDIELSTGTVTLDVAAQRLVDAIGMSPASAMTEVRRYTLMPGYNLCYAVGKHLIRELRTEAERVWGRGFSLERFHALVMSNGMAPMSVARERLALEETKK